MRIPEIALTVLFPILIAVGIALGMDAVSQTEFSLARGALMLAAVVAIGLTVWWFYLCDLTIGSAIMTFVTVGSLGLTLLGALHWIDGKQNTHCIVLALISLGDSASAPSFPVAVTNNGWYPAFNVRIRIVDYHFGNVVYNVGDVDPNLQRLAENVPPFPSLGSYEILIFSRSGNFREILKIYAIENKAYQSWNIDRMVVEGGKIVFIPLE